MRPLLIALFLFCLSCQTEPNVVTKQESEDKIRTEAAFLFANNLPADGCEEMIRLQSDSLLNKFTGFKPSPATLPILQKALKELPPNPSPLGRIGIVRFYETGKQVTIECGWGSRPQVPEIEILGITAP